MLAAATTTCLAAPVTTTIDVKCNGVKIGTLSVTVSDGSITGGLGSVTAKGGFKLTNAKERDLNCWCDNYNWFQIIKVSDSTFGPAMGNSVFVDAFPAQNINWGGGASTEDFVPFYFNRGGGGCGADDMTNRNGNTFDFSDSPQGLLTRATVGNPFTFEAWLCLSCDNNTGLSATGQNQNGSFGVLACIKWGFTITKSPAGVFTVTKIGPVASTPAPADVTSALTAFNAAAGVGTWTQTNIFTGCPLPDPPPTYTPPFPNRPGMRTFPTALCSYDPLTQTLTIGEEQVEFVSDTGLTFNPASPFAGDVVHAGRLAGGTYRLEFFDQINGIGLFISDPNYVNLYFDDPNDLADTKSSDSPLTGPIGNPSGWEQWLTGNTPVLIYDANAPGPTLYAPILNPTFDPTNSLFIQTIGFGLANGETPAYYFDSQPDIGLITQGFQAPGQTAGSAAIGITPAPPNPADLNGDGIVDAGDLATLLGQWGPCLAGSPCDADLNGDGTVDASDLAIMLGNWG